MDPPITLANDRATLETVNSYKYLGMHEQYYRLWMGRYLEATVARMNRHLARLKAAGYTWPPWIRLVIYRTFSRPTCDYGGPFIALWLKQFPEEHWNEQPGVCCPFTSISGTRSFGSLASATRSPTTSSLWP